MFLLDFPSSTSLTKKQRKTRGKKRPLTINSSDNDLIDLIKKRTNIYSKALDEIKCDNLTKNEIVGKIKEIYETN